MSPFIVAKFGGTSVQNIQAMKKSAVIAHQENAHIVVVSATSGTTNKLIEIMRLGELGKKKEARLLAQEIISFHHSLATEIELPEPSYRELKALFSEIESMAEGFSLLKEVSPKAHDYFVGQGERMSSILFHHVFELETHKSVALLDSRDFIKTDSLFGKGTPLLEEITKNCESLKPDKLYVAQGFIASDLNGTPTILGRGGSDYSAALYAYGVKAKELQIWTDVSGIATIDPRLYKNARPMNEITYSEASELASFGAKVLHPRTLNPLWNSETLISVKNTMDPKAPGTVIKRSTSSTPFVRGIAVKRKQRLITLTNPNMLHNYGFLAKIFSLFDQFHVSVDTVITSEISVSLTLDESDALTPNLLDELEKSCHVQQEANLCLVSMIGNHINTTKGMAFHVFDVLKDFNIRMINQGASAHNFCFMIKDEETENVVSKLHQKFLE
jgi:aspartate kinase